MILGHRRQVFPLAPSTERRLCPSRTRFAPALEEGLVKKIVECVPNFSEGRRQDVIDRIVASLQQVAGVQVVDVQSDIDHNRSVVTLVGEPQAAVEAAFRGAAEAARLIDMNHHRGGHPRMGAADVIPFIPVQGVNMQDCIELARQLGERIGTELGIPVYLYEEAATDPARRNLADVRRGEYEGLKEEIETDPQRAPDFGPASMGSAGATAVGARPPLVAFNVYLNTEDPAPAQAIARAVRHSSGGLRFVKALGLAVEGQTQVSMNLTDYRRTPIHRVLEIIRSEASRYGLVVTQTEIVGLVPAEALLDAARFYLQLGEFSPDQVLENRLIGPE
jgi:glutamate formiminotransferase